MGGRTLSEIEGGVRERWREQDEGREELGIICKIKIQNTKKKLILAFSRLRQEDCSETKARPGYRAELLIKLNLNLIITELEK